MVVVAVVVWSLTTTARAHVCLLRRKGSSRSRPGCCVMDVAAVHVAGDGWEEGGGHCPVPLLPDVLALWRALELASGLARGRRAALRCTRWGGLVERCQPGLTRHARWVQITCRRS